MEGEEGIVKTANKVRVFLWFFVVFIVLCGLGVPTIFNLEIEPLKGGGGLSLAYMLFDNVIFFDDPFMLTTQQIYVSVALLLSLLVAFSVLVWHIDRLFQQYAQGNIFTQQCIKHFFVIGWSLIALFVFSTIGDNLIEYFPVQEIDYVEIFESESSLGPVEFKRFFTHFISLDFSLLLAGVFVVAVARVMQIGVKLQNDVDATV